MKRVPYEVMVNEFERVLTKYGFEPKDAKASAELFAQNSMAGVYSHGLNRFPRVVEYLKKGEIDPKVKAEKIMGFGAFERWDGHRGFFKCKTGYGPCSRAGKGIWHGYCCTGK